MKGRACSLSLAKLIKNGPPSCWRHAPPFGVILVASLISLRATHSQAPAKFYAGPGVRPAEILRARGFHAQDHHIRTRDNYELLVTRGLNPLINRGQCGRSDKRPVLFIHGILESFSVFVINSADAEPRDFSNSSLANESLNEATWRLADEPSARSLPLLALNHGHEVWLMSRRGFPGSRTMLDAQTGEPLIQGDTRLAANFDETIARPSGPLSAFARGLSDYSDFARQFAFTFNKRFWNFSLDEQAQFDLPAVIDYILAKSGQKQLSLVGHSAGGALTLMALSSQPQINRKISSAIIWGGAISIGHDDIFRRLWLHKSWLETFQGAVPPTFVESRLQSVWNPICHFQWALLRICDRVYDFFLGASNGEASMSPEFGNTLYQSTSARELAQVLQNLNKVPMRRFDHGTAGNRARYKRDIPEPYELGRISLQGLSFFEGETDHCVSPADVAQTRKLLQVNYRYQSIRAPFNHAGFFFHRDTARLAIIPTLREIQLLDARGRQARELLHDGCEL